MNQNYSDWIGLREVPDYYLVFENGAEFHLNYLKSAYEKVTSQNETIIELISPVFSLSLEEHIRNYDLLTVKKIQQARRLEDGEDVNYDSSITGNWNISFEYETNSAGDPADIIFHLTL